MANFLEIQHLSKTFTQQDTEVAALKDVNLSVAEGNFLAIIGVSGCGKSTLLRVIGGLETEYTGKVLMEGTSIAGPSRTRGFVFQDHRLIPWLTVAENIRFSLPESLPNKESIISENIALTELEGFEKAYPKQLSGGMSQRVSIARALANNPRILLLDEPFGALDAITKIHLQNKLLEIWKRKKITMIIVTHDIDEAIYLGTMVAMMTPRPGRIKKTWNIELSGPRQRTGSQFTYYKDHVYREFFTEKEVPFIYNL